MAAPVALMGQRAQGALPGVAQRPVLREDHRGGGVGARAIWEYESLAKFEEYNARRGDYEGEYEEYKSNDPYYLGVFDHSSIKVEVWKDLERALWIE